MTQHTIVIMINRKYLFFLFERKKNPLALFPDLVSNKFVPEQFGLKRLLIHVNQSYLKRVWGKSLEPYLNQYCHKKSPKLTERQSRDMTIFENLRLLELELQPQFLIPKPPYNTRVFALFILKLNNWEQTFFDWAPVDSKLCFRISSYSVIL